MFSIITWLARICNTFLRRSPEEQEAIDRICPKCGCLKSHGHGEYPRKSFAGVASSLPLIEMIGVPRYRCVQCKKTFSRLPFGLLPRKLIPLSFALILAISKRSQQGLADLWNVASSSLRRWRQIGLHLLKKLPDIADQDHIEWTKLVPLLSLLLSQGKTPP